MTIMRILMQFSVATITTLAFAVLFSAPKKEWFLCGLTGAIGWIIYYVMTHMAYNKPLSAAAASFVLMIFARIFAVRRHNPTTVYMLPGIFPLVPGSGVYYTAYYLFVGNEILSRIKALETFEVAGAMVIGIVLGSSIPQKLLNLLGKRRKKG